MDNKAEAYRCLRQYSSYLTRQQLRTLSGQIKAGNVDGAMKGLNTILEREERRVGTTAQRDRSKAV